MSGDGLMVRVSQNTLRAFLRETLLSLSEEAVSPVTAAARGLALYVDPTGVGDYVLYSADAAVKALQGMSGETNRTMKKALVAANAVVGCLTVSTPNHTRKETVNTVAHSAAEKGYGPLLYDAALAFAGPLTADRESVSLSAERVWRHYYERRSDVVHTPLVKARGTRMHVSSRPWLNYAYSMPQASSNTNVLTARHDGVLRVLVDELTNGDVEAALMGAGSLYFDSKYVEA